MTTIEYVQVSVAVLSVIIQLAATVVARPLRHIVSTRFWVFIMLLNLLELFRRCLSLLGVSHTLAQAQYDTATVVIGLSISITLLVANLRIRKHAADSQQLARATATLAVELGAQQSPAFALAMHFINRTHAPDHCKMALPAGIPPATIGLEDRRSSD